MRLWTALAYFTMTMPAFALELDPPLDCTFGSTCFIQQYFDRDPGGAPLDYHCGHETYGGHDGTDFRILSLSATPVNVVSPADGVVRAVRDGVPNHLVFTREDEAAVKGIECGNGVVIDNPQGYQTQLCHMQPGSIVVKAGDHVARGQKIGLVGASGSAGFAHVHLTVRLQGRAIDPFTGSNTPVSCPAVNTTADFPVGNLWSAKAQDALAYRGMTILGAGFADHPVTLFELENKGDTVPLPNANAATILLYAHVMHPEAGDQLRLQANGPGGYRINAITQPYDHAMAITVIQTGVNRPAEGWKSGFFNGHISLLHRGAVVGEKAVQWKLQ